MLTPITPEIIEEVKNRLVKAYNPVEIYLYGPHEKQRRFVPTVINALLENQPAALTDGTEVRDFLHVADLCELIAEQIQNFDPWDGWLGNVSGGQQNAASLCELTTLCRELTGKTIPIAAVPASATGERCSAARRNGSASVRDRSRKA